jgi:hypothetical protein
MYRSFVSASRRHKLATVLFGAICLLVCANAHATALEVEIRIQSQSRFAIDFAASLRKRLELQPQIYALRETGETKAISNTVILTVGMEAFRSALAERPRRRILAAAIPRPAFLSMLEREGLTPETVSDVTGIFVGQSVRHNLALLRAIFPSGETVCAFDTRNIPFRTPATEASRKFGFTSIAIRVESPLDVLPKLEAAIARCESLWITHDTSAVTADNVRPLLLLALRHGKPVLGGVIPDFVELGALATISSTAEQNETEVINRLDQFRKSRTLGPSGYSSDWKIWVNRSVATTLKLDVVDDATLRERVTRLLSER